MGFNVPVGFPEIASLRGFTEMRNALFGLALILLAGSLPGCGGDSVNGPAAATPAESAAKAGAEAAKIPPPSAAPKK